MRRRFLGELSGSVSVFRDGLLELLRGVPKLTPEQERCIAAMEKDYEQLFGGKNKLRDRSKKLKTISHPDGHQ